MPLTNVTKNLIKQRVKTILNLENKVIEKKADLVNGDVSPFFLGLFGTKTTLLVKIGQSVQTTFGMSFYEQTCKILGESVGYTVENQKKVIGEISPGVEQYIRNISNSINHIPNRELELRKIKELSVVGSPIVYPDSTVDVYITTPEGKEILIDITTVKPNKKEFRILKEKLLRWAAMRYSQKPDVDIEPYIAIPYNPESTDHLGTNYSRHSDYYDRADILVGNELWLRASNDTCTINDIIEITSEIGNELRDEIDVIIDSV